MTAKHIFTEIGLINDNLIEAAISMPQRKKRYNWSKLATVAATIVFLLCGAITTNYTIKKIRNTDFVIEEGNLIKYTGSKSDVVIPLTVTKIENNAFENASHVRTITLTKNVDVIEAEAFKGCSNLKTIVLSPNNNSYIKKDNVILSADGKMLLFYEQSNIDSYVIPAGVLIIAANAFRSSELSNVAYPQGLLYIGSYSFANSLLRSIILPDSVKEIGEGAFSGCCLAVKGEVPETAVIGYNAFLSVPFYELLDELDLLSKYILTNINSPKDIAEIDLTFYLFEIASLNHQTEYESIPYMNVKYPQQTVSRKVLAEHLLQRFNVGEEYFDKYINGQYEFNMEYDYFDSELDVFKFVLKSWIGGPVLDRNSTSIELADGTIIVKTVLIDSNNKSYICNAEYRFRTVKSDKSNYLQLIGVAVSQDQIVDKAKVEIDGQQFLPTWITVSSNGQVDYLPTYEHNNGLNSIPWDNGIGFYTNEIKLGSTWFYGNTAYINVKYYGVYDVLVYDLQTGKQSWLSGAGDIGEYYREYNQLLSERANDGKIVFPIKNYYIVSVSPDESFALMQRSKEWDGGSLAIEYLIYDFKTGKESYIGDGFTKKYILSFLEEALEWIGNDRLRIAVHLSNPEIEKEKYPVENPDYFKMNYYDIIYDGENWNSSESLYELFGDEWIRKKKPYGTYFCS